MLTYFRNPNWQGGRKMITVEDSRRSVEKMVEFYNTFSEEKLVVIRGCPEIETRETKNPAR